MQIHEGGLASCLLEEAIREKFQQSTALQDGEQSLGPIVLCLRGDCCFRCLCGARLRIYPLLKHLIVLSRAQQVGKPLDNKNNNR